MALNDRPNLMRVLLAGTLVAALTLSACGRKGALEPPPGAEATAAGPTDDPAQKASKPDRPFILDGLL